MKIINWTLLFLAAFFCCFDSVKANPLRQDTIRDVTYQLYPLGIACRDNDMATIKRLLAGKYGAQNETYIEGWEKSTSNLLIYKRLCKI